MNRNLTTVVVVWLLISVGAIIWISGAAIFPPQAAEEATLIDDAFRLLLILSVPVATLVLTVMGYSLWRFRAADGEERDGPPLANDRRVAAGWLIITTALAVFVVFNPGLKGLRELEAAKSDDPLIIQVEAEQWHWNVTYPQYDLSYERALQIALPVDQTVKFELTSLDVIHSLWIPAFRLKQDALPGQTTTLYVTPDTTGSFESEPLLRAQCAELCGTGHPRMQMGVRVLEADAFDDWLASTKAVVEPAGAMDMDMDMDMESDESMNMEMGEEGAMDMDAEDSMNMDGEGGGMETEDSMDMNP